MRVAYKPRIRYFCDSLKRHRAGESCMSVDGSSIEQVVVQAFFEALQPAQLDALQALLTQRQQEEERIGQYWCDQVRRARYEAHLARRRYEAVDPENRLVAAELEHRKARKIGDGKTSGRRSRARATSSHAPNAHSRDAPTVGAHWTGPSLSLEQWTDQQRTQETEARVRSLPA
jgi:hypothetical protein